MSPWRIIRPILLCAALLLAGCSEENAAKYAGWLGAKSINESKADNFGNLSTSTLSGCKRNDEICYSKAKEYLKKSFDLYTRDCGFGNKTACRKLNALLDKWDQIIQRVD